MTSKNRLDAQRSRIVFTDEKLAAIPNASPERLVQLGLALPAIAAPVDQAVAKARATGKLKSTKLPPRLDRGRPRLRVEGEQLDQKKARAARVLAEALAMPGVPALLAYGFTKGDVRVLFTVLRRAAEAGGTCDWPVDKVACMAGVSRATVTRALGKLNAAAHLAVTWRERSGRKHETSLIRCGLSDLAGKVWARLTVRRSAVDECGRVALAARRKELAARANLDASKVSGEPARSFVEVSAAGRCGQSRSGERSALDSPSLERSPTAPEVKMLSGGRVLKVERPEAERTASTAGPQWLQEADPEAWRWGGRVEPDSLSRDVVLPDYDASDPMHQAWERFRVTFATKALAREKGQEG